MWERPSLTHVKRLKRKSIWNWNVKKPSTAWMYSSLIPWWETQLVKMKLRGNERVSWKCKHSSAATRVCACALQLCALVSDAMVFNVTKHSRCLLRCEVRVTQAAGLALYIFHNGRRILNVTSAHRDAGAALPYVTLSETVPLRWREKYECQLHLKDELITKSVFHSNLPGNHLPPEREPRHSAHFVKLTYSSHYRK